MLLVIITILFDTYWSQHLLIAGCIYMLMMLRNSPMSKRIGIRMKHCTDLQRVAVVEGKEPIQWFEFLIEVHDNECTFSWTRFDLHAISICSNLNYKIYREGIEGEGGGVSTTLMRFRRCYQLQGSDKWPQIRRYRWQLDLRRRKDVEPGAAIFGDGGFVDEYSYRT
jgi:hypothetical protein